jgi:hypothetical protein
LFAALEVASGRIVAEHSKRRRRVEFLGFSVLQRQIERGKHETIIAVVQLRERWG